MKATELEKMKRCYKSESQANLLIAEVERLQEVSQQWCDLAECLMHELRMDYAPGKLSGTEDYVQAIRKMRDKSEVERLRSVNAELAVALERLVAEQNGPPLLKPRHKAAWEAAMGQAKAALAKHEGGIS